MSDIDILANFKKKLDERKSSSSSSQMKINDRILLVDGLNLFIRGYCSSPACTPNGDHIGGVVGSLKSLSHAISLINPTRCLIIFDGQGGSNYRRKIYPQYKSNRSAKPKNPFNRRSDIQYDPQQEQKNREYQLLKFIQLLQLLPVTCISINNIQADDTIAYICQRYKNNSKLYIMSGDKDFIQLVSDKINVWSPIKKIMYTTDKVLQQYKIHPSNFINYRIIQGDNSDNIPGIYGIGYKNVIKFWGDVLSKQDYLQFQRLVDHVVGRSGKRIQQFKNSKQIYQRNYNLMQLLNVNIPGQLKLRIMQMVDKTQINKLNRNIFIITIVKNQMNVQLGDIERFLDNFRFLSSMAQKFNNGLNTPQ